jgi:hypothetical protein
MELQDPTVVYVAASNLEAHMLVTLLESEGISAFAVEDQSGASLWMLGTISQFHRPKVWVSKSDAPAAARILEDYEKRQQDLRHPSEGTGAIEARCEECGARSFFPASARSTIQDCPQCGAYVDVGGGDSSDAENPASSGDTRPDHGR